MSNAREQCLEVLRTQFGLSEFRPKQLEVIDRIFNRRHSLALLPTGYGKSICYQVPAQLLPGVTVVVSPLIALMQDQVDGLARRGIKNATLLNSTLDYGEITQRIAGIRSGAYKLVYVAPERFASPRFRALLADIDISLMVIDEAHCISQWGHDFRPHYRELGNYVREFGDAVVLAVTATATPTVKADIVRNLALPDMELIEGSFDRPNLLLSVQPVVAGNNKDFMLDRLVRSNSGPCIVYTSSRKEAERVATVLKRSGIKAGYYHAGVDVERRERVQRAFESDALDVIVCTVAFGMGVDKSNIRQVIHYNLPGSVEGYYQEAGRAGRDGEQALCTLLFQSKDIYIHKWLIDQKDVSEDLKRLDRQRLESVIAFAQSTGCRRRQILRYFGQTLDKCAGCDICGSAKIVAFSQANAREPVVSRPKPTSRKAAEPRAGAVLKTPPAGKDSRNSKVFREILAVAMCLSGKVGRTTYAQILTASGSSKLREKGFDRLPQFGSCSGCRQDDVLGAVDQMIQDGYLTVSGGMYPKVSMTAAGRSFFSTL